MPRVTPEENMHRRRNAVANLAVGGAMMGAGREAQKHVSQRTGVKNTFDLARQVVRSGKAEGRHAKYVGGWLGTRGVAAAGVPLVAIGTKNILTRKPEPVAPPNIKRDVLGETVRRTAFQPEKKKPLSEIKKMNANDAAINTLAQHEQKDLVRRKKKQSKYSLASAGLGATALGLQSPRLAALAVRRAPRLANVKALKAVADVAPKANNMSNTVGVGSLGVGALGSLNFARINRSETKADERSSTALKKVNKAVKMPDGSWVRMRTMNSRITKPGVGHRVEAMHRQKNIGFLEVQDKDAVSSYSGKLAHPKGKIRYIEVKDDHRRKGVGTSMYKHAQKRGLNPLHSDNLSWHGEKWANSVGGPSVAKSRYPIPPERRKDIKVHAHGDRDHAAEVAKAFGLPRIPRTVRPPRFAGVKAGGLRRVANGLGGWKQITVRGSVG